MWEVEWLVCAAILVPFADVGSCEMS
uniref:Uncharacterized protein n=1 Tax=Arundo donax TaxID=35708 RepID=A0A0A8ZSX2_ARUDO